MNRGAFVIVGFTGTQAGVTREQLARIASCLRRWRPIEFHHGDCVGADAVAHSVARGLGIAITIHPPLIDAKRAFCEGATLVLPPDEYMARNQSIVDASTMMLATPKGHDEQLRSGTWSTIRRARKAKRPGVIIFPDGSFLCL